MSWRYKVSWFKIHDAGAWSKLFISHFIRKSFHIACTHYYIHSSSDLVPNCLNTETGVLYKMMPTSFSTTMQMAVYHIYIKEYWWYAKGTTLKTFLISKSLRIVSILVFKQEFKKGQKMPSYRTDPFYLINKKNKHDFTGKCNFSNFLAAVLQAWANFLLCSWGRKSMLFDWNLQLE